MDRGYPDFAPALLAVMAARGAEQAVVPILQPADPFLDMAGEDLRRRIFMTQSETGESLCLRPEFTIPVCRMHIASGKAVPRRYGYLGEVFRQRRQGGNEFFQTGIEDIGDPDHAAADARSVADALAILEAMLPGRKFRVACGDKSVFEAVLAGLELPPGWQKRLARAFGSHGLIEQALADLTQPNGAPELESELADCIAANDRAGLVSIIENRMRATDMPLKASRTAEEIAGRLIEKVSLAKTRLSDRALAALQAFLAIRAPLGDAAAELVDFSRLHDIELGMALQQFSERVDALALHEAGNVELSYDASFGRSLEYYSGFVYEIRTEGVDLTLAGGGRYDRLLTLLGAPDHIPGVGFSVWLDRIEQVMEASA